MVMTPCRRGQNHPSLESTSRTEVTMELHIQGEKQNERDQQLGHDPQDQVISHGLRSLRRRRNSAITPAPAVNTTVVSPSVS